MMLRPLPPHSEGHAPANLRHLYALRCECGWVSEAHHGLGAVDRAWAEWDVHTAEHGPRERR